jgi:hypothetical protein
MIRKLWYYFAPIMLIGSVIMTFSYCVIDEIIAITIVVSLVGNVIWNKFKRYIRGYSE